jgi:salicylate hydroxylase
MKHLILTNKNGQILSRTPLDPEMSEVYGTPYWLIHRPDYHNLLHEAALESGCDIRVKSRVESVNESVPSLTLTNGETWKADIIIGADGLRSKIVANNRD